MSEGTITIHVADGKTSDCVIEGLSAFEAFTQLAGALFAHIEQANPGGEWMVALAQIAEQALRRFK